MSNKQDGSRPAVHTDTLFYFLITDTPPWLLSGSH